MRRAIEKFRSLHARLGAAARRLRADERGVSFIITAMAAVALIGFSGLAIDVVMWQVQQRSMQGAADQAAIAAGTAYKNDFATETGPMGTSTTALNAAYAAVIKAGYPVSAGCSSPPCVIVADYTSGATCAGDNCVAVTITETQPRYFTGIFIKNEVSASAGAVGAIAPGTGSAACIMALDKTGTGVVTSTGTATLNLTACSLYNSSNDPGATSVNNNASINGSGGSGVFLAQASYTGGNIDIPVTTGVVPPPDPFAALPKPTVGACLAWPNPPTNIPSGTYCPNNSDLDGSTNSVAISFAPGAIIVIDGSKGLSTKGQVTISGTGVMLYVLNGGSLNAGTVLNITAPTEATCASYPATCPYVGVAMWFGDTSQVTYSGGGASTLSGAIYAPEAAVTYSGGSTNPSTCTRLIAASVTLSGSSPVTLDNSGCPPLSGTGLAGQAGEPMLVE